MLISYCRDCGGRYEVFPEACLRCNGIHPVRSPCDVLSWLDEVKEREAFDSLVGTSKRSSPTTTSTTMLASTTAANAGILNSAPSVSTAAPHSETSPGMHRLDILRRHARGAHLWQGWDGSLQEIPRSSMMPFLQLRTILENTKPLHLRKIRVILLVNQILNLLYNHLTGIRPSKPRPANARTGPYRSWWPRDFFKLRTSATPPATSSWTR